jgi:ribosomal protein S25
MGGGKKNKSLSQMTKTKKGLGITVPDVNNKKVMGELKGLKVLTPSVVASRLNIRLSLAKDFLNELEKRKMIEYVSGGKNLKIYKLLAQNSV